MPNKAAAKTVMTVSRLSAKTIPLIILLILLAAKGEIAITSISSLNIILYLTIALVGGTGLQLTNNLLNKKRAVNTWRERGATDIKNIIMRSLTIFAFMQIFFILTYWSTKLNPLLHLFDILTIPGYFALTAFISTLIASAITGVNRIYDQKTIGKLPRLLRYDSKLNEILNNLSIILTSTTTLALSLLINFTANPFLFFISLPITIVILFATLRLFLPKTLQTIGLLRKTFLELMQHISNKNEAPDNETIALLNITAEPKNNTNRILRQLNTSTIRRNAIISTNTIFSGAIVLSTPIITILAGIFLAQSLVSYQDANWDVARTEKAQNLAPWRGIISALLLLQTTFSSTFDIKRFIEEVTSVTGHARPNSLLPTTRIDYQSHATITSVAPSIEDAFAKDTNTDTNSELSVIAP